MDIKDFAKKIEVNFKNIDFLREALTHRSYLNEHRDYKLDHNERMEFLGDAVLELVVTEHLYQNFKNPEVHCEKKLFHTPACMPTARKPANMYLFIATYFLIRNS